MFLCRPARSLCRRFTKVICHRPSIKIFLVIFLFNCLIFIWKQFQPEYSKFNNKTNLPDSDNIDFSTYIDKINLRKIGNHQCVSTEIKLNFEEWKNKAAKYQHPDCYNSRFLNIQEDGTVKYDYEYLKKKDIVLKNCGYTVIKWGGSDFLTQKQKKISISHDQKVDTNEEFFEIKCRTNRFKPKYLIGNF